MVAPSALLKPERLLQAAWDALRWVATPGPPSFASRGKTVSNESLILAQNQRWRRA